MCARTKLPAGRPSQQSEDPTLSRATTSPSAETAPKHLRPRPGSHRPSSTPRPARRDTAPPPPPSPASHHPPATAETSEPRFPYRKILNKRQLLALFPAISPRTLKHWIHKSADRHVSQGGQRRILPGNGLARAIIRKGRLILFDEELFLAWLYGSGEGED